MSKNNRSKSDIILSIGTLLILLGVGIFIVFELDVSIDNLKNGGEATTPSQVIDIALLLGLIGFIVVGIGCFVNYKENIIKGVKKK